MKYIIWDNDNEKVVCNTDSRKEAFTAILTHLIEVDYITAMWPIATIRNPKEQMPNMKMKSDVVWTIIRDAEAAYVSFKGLIPIAQLKGWETLVR